MLCGGGQKKAIRDRKKASRVVTGGFVNSKNRVWQRGLSGIKKYRFRVMLSGSGRFFPRQAQIFPSEMAV
ncbi:hypothetical protein JCM31598_42300 [Desulfonatronum parangueonense]